MNSTGVDAPDRDSKRAAVRAARHFLEGTECESPDEAVQSGKRTIMQWCECLSAAKHDLPFPILETRRVKPRPRPKPAGPDTLPLSKDQRAVLEFVRQYGPTHVVVISTNLATPYAAAFTTLQHLRSRGLVDTRHGWDITVRGLERLEREPQTEQAA
jgi:hypothetical protein